MKLKKIIIPIIGFIILMIFTIPVIYTKQLNKNIKLKQQQLYTNYGIELKEKSNKDTFFKFNREYILNIKTIVPIALKLNPKLSLWDLKILEDIFSDTKILIKIQFTKYPLYHKNAINVSLYKLNKIITAFLELRDNNSKKLLSFFNNKGVQFSGDIDILSIGKIKMKDINLDLSFAKLNIHNLFLDTNKKLFNFSLFNIEINDKHSSFKLSIKNLKNYFDKKAYFNVSNKLYIEDIEIYKKEYSHLETYKIHNIKKFFRSFLIVNKLKISNIFNIDEISVKDNYNSFNIKNINLDYVVKNLEITPIIKLINSHNLTPQLKNETINDLLNGGFDFYLKNFSIENITTFGVLNYSFDKIQLNASIHLKKNSSSSFNPKLLKDKFKVSLYLETTQNNINNLLKIEPFMTMYLLKVLEKKDKNRVFINIKYKNNHLISNGRIIL